MLVLIVGWRKEVISRDVKHFMIRRALDFYIFTKKIWNIKINYCSPKSDLSSENTSWELSTFHYLRNICHKHWKNFANDRNGTSNSKIGLIPTQSIVILTVKSRSIALKNKSINSLFDYNNNSLSDREYQGIEVLAHILVVVAWTPNI